MFYSLILAFFTTVFIFSLFMWVRNEVTYINHKKIINAIDDYVKATEEYEKCGILFKMESYYDTLWRLWDFGCENILPKEDYELIKPYIKKGKQK